jgi:hypothetical protein
MKTRFYFMLLVLALILLALPGFAAKAAAKRARRAGSPLRLAPYMEMRRAPSPMDPPHSASPRFRTWG